MPRWRSGSAAFIWRSAFSSRGGTVAKSGAARSPKRREATSRELTRVEGQHAPAADFDRLIHERMRLGIVSALAVNASLTFSELKRLMKTTDGNLSVHARRL